MWKDDCLFVIYGFIGKWVVEFLLSFFVKIVFFVIVKKILRGKCIVLIFYVCEFLKFVGNVLFKKLLMSILF